MGKGETISYKTIQKELNLRITQNLLSLLEQRGLTPTSFMNQLNIDGFFSCQHFNRLLKRPDETPISVAVAALLCDFFGISFDNLISENFDPKEYIKNDTRLHKKYIEMEALYKSSSENFSNKETPNFYFDFENNDTIEVLPNSRFFKGYLQKYFCYYFPTSSKESSKEKILYARLELSDAKNYCKATLKIDTRGVYPETESDFRCDKEYVGYTVISSSVQNVYCVLFGDDPGDFCFIAFRYMFLNRENLYCRIAEVLSSSSGNESRRPTVLRMFISNTHIKKEHIPFIASSIRLNYSKIAISKESLDILSQKSDDYRAIIDTLLNDSQNNILYVFNERKEIIAAGEKYLKTKERALEFAAEFRNLSYSYKYNKVSESSDDNIKDLLTEKGYYTACKESDS